MSNPRDVAAPAADRVDGRVRRGEVRREQIVRAALEAFARNGFHGTTLREISRAVGISDAGLLHHFGSKERLLTAVLEARDALESEHFEEYDHSPEARLSGVRDLIERNLEAPGLVALHVVMSAEATDPEHPSHDFYVERYRQLRHKDEDAWQALHENGALVPGVDPTTLTRLITALLDGLQLQWLLDPEDVDIPELFDAFVRLITADSAAPGGNDSAPA